MTSSTAVEAVITKDKKRRRTNNNRRYEESGKNNVFVLRALPLFPLTPGDLKLPQPTPAVDYANVDEELLTLRLGPPDADDDQPNMMLDGPDAEVENVDEMAMAMAMVVEEENDDEERVWEIRKVLTKSDTNDCSRLMLTKDMAHSHVMPHLTAEERERVESGERKADGAAEVVVRDMDTRSEHRLQFRRWMSSGGYVLNNEWQGGFVRRRQLKEGDEVGLYYDPPRRQFVFSVLSRARQQ